MYEWRSQRTEFSLQDPLSLLAGGDCIRGNGRSKSYLRHSIPPTSLFVSFLFAVSLSPATLLFFHLKLVASHLLILFGLSLFSPPFHLPFLSPLAYLPNFGRFFIRSPVSFTRCIRIFFSKYWYLLSFLRFLRLCSELFQWYFLGSFVDFGLRILRRKHTLDWIFNETYDFNYNRTTFI